MEGVLAGFVAGAAMGLLSVALGAVALVQHPGRLEALHTRFPAGTSLAMLMTGLSLATQAGWGLVGLAVGGVYAGIEGNAQDGLASPAWGFSVFFLVLATLGAASATLVQPSWWLRAVVAGAIFAGLFGWMLPNLAEA